MREWFDDLDPYVDEEEQEDYIPFKYDPWDDEIPEGVEVRREAKDETNTESYTGKS